ncbi:VCBS domain-containing protein [Shewanella sp. Isolate8]|uniref:beta strand repeat-containing protein n=1 Tax=Shewanella sp. Isolate8 TaxID=2908529 RepID=UPI001EFD06BF|nr:VCBS domain-containing protein [Shewanella sp. Isolate8]
MQFLAEDETITLSFEVTVTDNDGGSDTKTVSLTITGTNDLPVLTVDATGGVTEDASNPNLTDSGALSFTDVDVNNTHSVTEVYNNDIGWSGGDLTSVLSAGQIQSLIDGFSVDSDSWDYSILNSLVQFLAEDETITLSFEVTVTDNDGGSDTKTVSLTITGTNDLPVLTVDASGGVVEDASNPNLTDSGALSFTDVDVNNTHSVTEVYNNDIGWSGGDLTNVLSASQIQSLIDGFSVDSDSWDYSILNSLVQFLAEDETITLSFEVTVTDNDGGSDTKTVSLTITGTNDLPVLTVDATGGVTEDASNPNLTDSGALSFTDVDVNNTHSVTEVYNDDISWDGGDLTNVLSAGQIQSLIDGFSVDSDSWDYSILNSLVQFLAEDETITLSFEVTVTDNDGGSDTKTVSLTITGTNDLPVLTVDATGGVTEDASNPNLTDSGALSFTDVDVNNTHSVTEVYNNDISWSGGDLTSVLSAGQIQSLIDGFSVDSDSWDYSILNSLVQFLAEDETITLSFEVTVTDNDGGSDTKTVSLTITGTNDLPVLTVDASGGVTEDASNPNLTDSGALSFTDVDVNNTHSVTEVYNNDISWSGGDLTSVLSAGQIQSLIDGFSVDSDSWDYSILNSLVQFLAEDETITLSFEVTVTDNDGGSDTKTVSLTITGTNDLPVLTVDASGGVTEDASNPNLTDSGALSFTDVDVNNTHSVTEVYNNDIGWSGGDLTSVLSAGQIQSLIDGFSVDSDSWDYSILNSDVQFLAEDETITLSFEVTVTDNDGGSDTKTVSLTITGTNDLPVLTVDATGGVTEDASNPNLTDSGALSFTDVDVNNTHSVTEVYNNDISWSGGDLTSVLSAGQIQSLIDGFSVDSDSWDYSILNSLVQFLAEDETITLSFNVTVTDNDGGTDTQTVTITINGTNDPIEGEFAKEIWVPASLAEIAIPYLDGYPLNIDIPTDQDYTDVITITGLNLSFVDPDETADIGEIWYIDDVTGELTQYLFDSPVVLSASELGSLIYVPGSDGDTGEQLDINLTFTINSGSDSVDGNFVIHTVPANSLGGNTVLIGDGSSPLTSGNDQDAFLTVSSAFASAINLDPSSGALDLFTDFQKSPFDIPIPNSEIGGQTGIEREEEVSVRLTINGITFIVIAAANGVTDWFYDADSGLMNAHISYTNILMESDNSITLADYLAANPVDPGDIWTITYLDNDGGSYQARFVQATFTHELLADTAVTVTGTDDVDNLIFGTTEGDSLTGANLDDEIYGREGNDSIFGLEGDDQLIGGSGDDLIEGGSGNDIILGGLGNDTIDGGIGADILIGGAGSDTIDAGIDSDIDTLVWDIGSDDNGIDTVLNFDISMDQLDLSAILVDEENGMYSLDQYLAFNFSGGNTEISVDANHDGIVDLTIVLNNVDLTNNNTLSDTQIINNLLGNENLIIDTIP